MQEIESNKSIQPTSSREIAPAVETFGAELETFLGRVELPRDDILVPYERRRPVFQNLPTVLESLTHEQKSVAVYISKFVAACAVGLFDAGLNYLWNETIRNLREKVARFDLSYFFDSVVSDATRRAKLRTEADLEKLDDWELIRGCHSTGIISENGYRHLDYIRNMRNHASAAHPNQNDITGLQIISWLETCIVEVLAREPAGPVIEVRKLLHSIRTEQLTESDLPQIEKALPSLPEDLSTSLLRALIGMYTDREIDSQVRENIRLVAKPVWDIAPAEARRQAGVGQATLAANGEVTRSNLAREFIEIVDGIDFLSVSTLTTEISAALDNLETAHNGWQNFYAEPAPARMLQRLIPRNGNVPRAVMSRYVKMLTLCTIGNGYGVSWAAEGYYQDLMSRFSDNHIFLFINLVRDPEVSSRLRFPNCAGRYQSLATQMKDRAVRPRLKEVLTFIESFDRGQVHRIISSRDFNRLRQTLQT